MRKFVKINFRYLVLAMVFDNEKPFIFRINEDGNGPNLLLQVCFERGWQIYEETGVIDDWNLWWRTKSFPAFKFQDLPNHKYTNHVPKGFLICRKDNLTRYFKCMRKVYGSVYDFNPESYILPQDYRKLISQFRNDSLTILNDNDVWICKPVSESKGRGIFIFQTLEELVYSTHAIVQRYVKNPLLIGGYKFDLRLYVLVPSFDPLTIYLYREGLVRFATEKFTLNNLRNPFAHLTNTSVNKFGPGYGKTKERVGIGCKWSLQQLRCYLQQTVGCDWLLWQSISTLITLTIVGYASKMPRTVNSFEFYGFDILVDSEMKPWLLEVNSSPALGNDCSVDSTIKKPMLHDMFDLLGFPVSYTGLSSFTFPNTYTTDETKTCKFSANFFEKKSRKLIYKKERCTISKWGNGKDWNNAKPIEGNWVKIFPILSDQCFSELRIGNSNLSDIGLVILSTSKYFHIAKRVFQTNSTDDVLCKCMAPYLRQNCVIWLPPV